MSNLMGNNNAGGGFRGGGGGSGSGGGASASGGGGHGHRDGRKDYSSLGAGSSMDHHSTTDHLLNGIVRHVFVEDLRTCRNLLGRGQCHDSLKNDLLDYGNIKPLLRHILEDRKKRAAHSTTWSSEGRMGSETVQLPSKGDVGNFSIQSDHLGLTSQDNFSTIRATTCVYKGKWQYEIMLGTKGVMQVGWATAKCEFSEEKGVGDTSFSYAYDGNRQRKWNVATFNYGDVWQSGDIISCLIDLDQGEVAFCRNGKNLGPAFSDIRLGPGFAYFPALSLALGENITVNFGATPLRYPQHDYLPLQAPPEHRKAVSDACVGWLMAIVDLAHSWHKYPELSRLQMESKLGSQTCLLLVAHHIAVHLGPLLAQPYVVQACLLPAIERLAGVKPVSGVGGVGLMSSATTTTSAGIHTLFDLLMGALGEHELKQCIESLILCLLTEHKQVSEDVYFRGQTHSLRLLYALLSHARLRKFCLTHIVFDKVRFPSFINIKMIDESGLVNALPKVWWSSKDKSYTHGDKVAYEAACHNILQAVQEVERLQVSILRLLMCATDAPRFQDTSRALFLAKFRFFLKDHSQGFRPHSTGYTPLPVILCLFHRLFTVFQQLWTEERGGAEQPEWAEQQGATGKDGQERNWTEQGAGEKDWQEKQDAEMLWSDEQGGSELWPKPGGDSEGGDSRVGVWAGQGGCEGVWVRRGEEDKKRKKGPGTGTTSGVMVPPRVFYNSNLNYFDTHRLGGLESHLKKTFHKEIQQSTSEKTMMDLDKATAGSSGVTEMEMGQPSTSGALLGNSMAPRETCEVKDTHHLTLTSGAKPGGHLGVGASQCKLTRDSLYHLLDGIILLYHIGAHKQLGKVAAQRDAMNDNIAHVQEIDKKIAYAQEKGLSVSIQGELQSSRKVFIGRLEEQARQQAWVMAAVHSTQKYSHLASLASIILASLKAASGEGQLFGFVPDFYVDSLTELCTSLRLYFTIPPHCQNSYEKLLTNVGEFLARHFCDPRIVYADSKDSLIQALAGFVCHKTTLKALENMPKESRIQMVKNLVQPYENRAWAQNNWVLVRFWKGCGFGFRYTKSPHMTNKFGPKPPNSDNSNFTQSTAPCPSPDFQRHVVEVLEESQQISTPFLNSLLNQLNWAFSEFIGMLQEIQNASNRPERVFIDSRQLRICATCFDLALALLRVLEMVVTIAPQLFTDFKRPNAEFLLSRLCQLLCQVLNRVSGWCGCFGHVVGLEIPGLETIHHYPILTAATGILITLLGNDLGHGNPKVQAATKTLLNEPSFQITSIRRLLEVDTDTSSSSSSSSSTTTPASQGSRGGASNAPPTPPKFSLRNYPQDINREEIGKVERILEHLESCLAPGQDQAGRGTGQMWEDGGEIEDDDSLCTICYAYPAQAIFSPCLHTSCRACVTQHLMNKTECFFCKVKIQLVKEEETGIVIYRAPDQESQQKS